MIVIKIKVVLKGLIILVNSELMENYWMKKE